MPLTFWCRGRGRHVLDRQVLVGPDPHTLLHLRRGESEVYRLRGRVAADEAEAALQHSLGQVRVT